MTADYEKERLDLKREAQWNRAGQLREEKLQEELRLIKASMVRSGDVCWSSRLTNKFEVGSESFRASTN